MTNREAYLKALVELVGTPYLWDGKLKPNRTDWNGTKGPEPYRGLDCSGTQTNALYTASGGKVDHRLDWNTAKLWADPSMLVVPDGSELPGDLALYLRPDGSPHHVMAKLYGGLVIGAAGGNQTTLTLAVAQQQGARVMVWSHRDFMVGFGGWRRFPFLDADVIPAPAT